MKNRASGGFTFLYVFIKSKNTSEQMKLYFHLHYFHIFSQTSMYKAHESNKRSQEIMKLNEELNLI